MWLCDGRSLTSRCVERGLCDVVLLCVGSFHWEKLKLMLDTMAQQADKHIDRWLAAIDKSPSDHIELDMHEEMSQVGFAVIRRLCIR